MPNSPMMSTERQSSTRSGRSVAVAHERVRAAILKGELPAGAKVSHASLSAEYDVGGTPLREALRMLESEGLVVSEPNRGVRIASLTAADAEELYIMRVALECVAVRITVPLMSANDIAELEGCMAQMDYLVGSGDRAGAHAPHRSFHRLLVAGAGDRLAREIAELDDQAERCRRLGGANTTYEERRAEHRAIVDAAAAADGQRAAVELARHYAHSARAAISVLDASHDATRLRTTIAAVADGAQAALAPTA